jgi:hypothetical protein
MSYGGGHLGFPKMAATAGLSLTLDPMGKMFQNASSLKSLGQLKRNCHFEFHIGTKNVKFVEDHPMNIHVQFGSLDGPLQSQGFLFRYEIQNGGYGRT